MVTDTITTPPPVTWAQRKTCVFVVFNVECEKPDIKIENRLISFKGLCGPEQKLNEVELSLFDEIDPEKSIQVNKGRFIELVLAKVNSDAAFWPALTSDKKKHHWLKVDFQRWQDEDESEDDTDWEGMNQVTDDMGPSYDSTSSEDED
ncbi:unnamed protein product [Pieris macdunnoughi]|uniref:CS domain-containing protein n=1 Tax=Pieris macdunnoughi TaxID=345717 RepID=A0A821U2G9_9NEOP|nr:unnamed protein product [Pieris macdunnoughi]